MNEPQPNPTGIAAVRGAVSVAANDPAEIVGATRRLLEALMAANRFHRAQVVSAIFTATDDLDADFPAHAARQLGWQDVPLLCAREIAVRGSMPRVIRVLLTITGVASGTRLTPVYLGEAARLRPDLASGGAPGAAAALAVIATPVDTIPVLVERAASVLPAGAALLDTGSARGGITAALEAARARGVAAVGGHPIAGSEGRGLDAARGDLFRGSSF